MKLIALALLLSLGALGQGPPLFAVVQKTTPATAEAITVHFPAGGPVGRTAQLDGASVYCSVECEFTLERDGTLPTVPTSVALTVVKINETDTASAVIAFRSSNVGTSTVIGRYIVPAGGTISLELRDKGLKPSENLTIRISSASSGTYITNIKGREF